MKSVAEPLRGIAKLGPDHIAQYREQGYLAIEGVFTADEVAELQAVTDEFIERSRQVAKSDSVFDLGDKHTADSPKLRRIKHPYLQHPAYDQAMRNERVVDLIAQLIGDDLRYQGGKLNIKPPGDLSPVEWHQDWGFFPHTNDDILAVGIAIDDQTLDNGCLMVVPGSHRGPIYDHHQDGFFVGAVNPEGLNEQATAIVLPAGGISLHHVRLLHGSAPNTSSNSRKLLLFEYVAADAWPLTENQSWEKLSGQMIRGKLAVEPRMEALPVRLPYPRDVNSGSIFEVQKQVKQKGFAGAMS